MSRCFLATVLWLAAAQSAFSQTPSVLLSSSELAGLLKDPSVVVLHVADRAASFEEGHIPGARFVRYGEFAVDGGRGLGSELPPADQLERVFEAVGVSDSSRVVIYGSSTVAAARAFFTLDVFGHSRVSLLDGGLRVWRAEGRPIETGTSQMPARAGQFTPKLNAARVVTADFIRQQMPSAAGMATGSAGESRPPAEAIALVDVRPDPEYLGTDGGMGGAHAVGHIAGARQLPWDTLVSADGRFLPREQLQTKLQAAGAVPGKPVVSYCMIGMRASVVYFVARHLGYDARLYDGSIIDWTQRKLPTKTGR